MTDSDRATCAVLASLLRAAALLAIWGFALTCLVALVFALSLHALSTGTALGFGAVLILGAVERYFAIRLRFDMAIFDYLARNAVDTLTELDKVLNSLGLRAQQPHQIGRPLSDRTRGTLRLLRLHATVVIGQSAVFAFTLIARYIP